MIDEISSDGQQQDADSYGTDPEAPILPRSHEPGPKKQNAKEYARRAASYVQAAYESVITLLRWIGKWIKIAFKSANFWIATATVAIAVSTGIYTHYAGKQWEVMKGQLGEIIKQYPELKKSADAADNAVKVARQSLEISERAYLYIALPQADLTHGRILVPVENSGHVPAGNLQCYVHEMRLRAADNKTLKSSDMTVCGDRTKVPPGKGYFGFAVTLSGFTPDEGLAIMNKQERLMVAGKVVYEIGFADEKGTPKTDESAFCFTYAPDPQVPWNACPIVTFADLQKMQGQDKPKP